MGQSIGLQRMYFLLAKFFSMGFTTRHQDYFLVSPTIRYTSSIFKLMG
jgi:hypothetical protein